jgi:hypothetical protein
MEKFKVGDKVRVIDDAGGGKLGDVCTVTDLGDDGYIVLDGLTGGAYGLYDHRLELVPAWQPKVGDRVVSNDEDNRGEIGTVVNGLGGYDDITMVKFDTWRRGHDGVNLLGNCGKDHWLVKSEDLQPAAPAPLTIEAGKLYKTRDGRKVGPMTFAGVGERSKYWAGAPGFPKDNWYTQFNAHWGKYVGRTDIGGGENADDIIAEWIDEPAASNDNAAPAKFKVGDRVRFRSGYASSAAGNEATVVAVNVWGDDGIQVDQGGYFGVSTEAEKDLELVAPAAPTAIVALIEDGQPKPATRPYVHTTEDAAKREADRLASVHKGQQFGVYVLTTTSQEAAPTYAHEWQRLAVAGRKINAIKELRGITGLGLKSTKDAVEYWLANDEPRSRIAA